MSELTAPVGTPIRCWRCDTPIATLVKPIAHGEVVRADAVKLESGEPPYDGMAILCPNGCGGSFYVEVNGAVWGVG